MPQTPSMIVLNGRVWTGVEGAPEAEAVAIAGDRIAAVGTVRRIRALAGPETQIIDAEGRRVIPGITDSHTHFLWAGLQRSRLDLSTARNRVEFIDQVRAAADKLSPGQWLLGGRYAVEGWSKPEQPDRSWIDSFTRDHPVYITRTDLHQALVNSVTLRIAGITRDGPPDPPGGAIERDPDTGEPTGILKEAATELVMPHIPEPSRAEHFAAIEAACSQANEYGITSVHDMSLPADTEVFKDFHHQRGLNLRIHSYVTTEDFAGTWANIQAERQNNEWLHIRGFKVFADGSLGSRTAYMREPYLGIGPAAKYPRGLRSRMASDWPAFSEKLRWAHEAGAQLAVHAIGDQAVSDLLDLFTGIPDAGKARHRVEHVQHVLPEDPARFARLGVIASMQPAHKADDGPWAEAFIGPQRLESIYAWGSLLNAGATVCFGSDSPVASNNPFAGLAQAVTGLLPDGRVLCQAQNIPVRQALKCYTVTPPYAVFREHDLGTLEPNKFADLVILDRDVLRIPPEQVGHILARWTIVGGRVVWPAGI
ncbi:MAG: amidohydrolase [Phycisphaerales bacterium]|nr:MAG: amidohydrolase [Phycisphaerales bacterium]